MMGCGSSNAQPVTPIGPPVHRVSLHCFIIRRYMLNSLEATHPIWVWIMKVKGPKNQADFIEVLYVVVNAWGATFLNTWEYG